MSTGQTSLVSALGWKCALDYPKGIILAGDQLEATSHDSILPLLLTHFLKPSASVRPTAAHASAVLYLSFGGDVRSRLFLLSRKLGLNLDLIEAQNRLLLLAIADPANLSCILSEATMDDIKNFFHLSHQSDRRLLFIITGLSELEGIGIPSTQVYLLISSLLKLANSYGASVLIPIHRDVNISNVHAVHCSSITSHLSTGNRLWRWLVHEAHTVICTSPLASGLSRQIHGKLALFRGGNFSSSAEAFQPQSFLYYTSDQTLSLVSKGSVSVI